MTVSIYAIFQLSQLENLTKSILSVDTQLSDHRQKLSDLLLTMMRYEKKYIILKDKSLYNHFLQAGDNFEAQLKETSMLSSSAQIGNILDNVKGSYETYSDLINEEVSYIKSGRQYSADTFKQKKEQAVNVTVDNLKDLEAYSQISTYNKVKKLGEAEGNASNVAIIIGVISLVFGVVISTVITITITKPLSIIKKKTKEIASGNFGDELNVNSPPEIQELAHSFNLMCAQLEKVDQLKSDFFSLMSHELRTPLTTIKEGSNLVLERLREDKGAGKQKRLLNIINEECIRLINLVNSLLDMSRMEAGMMLYTFSLSDITPLIDKVTREIEPLAETKHIKVKRDIIENPPHVKIDAERILHVLRNLLGNAIKYTKKGGTVSITVQADTELKVSISDTGSGIKIENHDMIFNKYYQVNSKEKGTGLGLFIVKHIIDAHGGKVWIEKTSKQGTTFSFTLPL
jgi:two-component system sensor histidine kinase GlrK